MRRRTILLYGDSGDTKTTQAYYLAKWMRKRFPKGVIRMIHGDGGGYAPFEDSGMIERGEVQLVNVINETHAYATLNKLAEGYWPLKPTTKGESNWKLLQKTTKLQRVNNVSMYIIEGLTSIGALWKDHLSHVGSGNAGFKHSYIYAEQGYEVGGLDVGHIGLIQGNLYRLFHRQFNSLPVPLIVVTARVGKGATKTTGELVLGPKGTGDAQTPDYPSWFMDCIHLDHVESNDGDHKVAWIRKHRDFNVDLPYLAKVQVQPELVPQLREKYPEGYVTLGHEWGIVSLYRFIDKLTRRENGDGKPASTEETQETSV